MTAPMRTEQDLQRLLAQLAEGTRPDYRDSLVEATARTPQRPAWTMPGRWLPMDITARRVNAEPIPRALLLLVVVALLVAAALIGIVATSRRPAPPPFGPARNGLVVFSSAGDLFALETGSTTPRPFVMDPAFDSDPQFSNQGDRVAFGRGDGAIWSIYVADADGQNVRAVTAPLIELSSFAWSPDGATIAVAHEVNGYPTVSIYRTDGSGGRALDLGMPASEPAWRPGHPDQLLVRRQEGASPDLFLVDVASGHASKLDIPHEVGGAIEYDGQRASWSPDGSQLTFEIGIAKHGVSNWPSIRLRVADVGPDGTLSNVRPLQLDALSDYEYMGRWLTSGDRFAFATQKACVWQVWVTEGLDLSTATAVGEPFEDCTNLGVEYQLSPDAAAVATLRTGGTDEDPMWIGGTDGTARRKIAGTVTGLPTWQRLAP